MRSTMALTPNDGDVLKVPKIQIAALFTSFLTFSKDKREGHCYNTIAEIHIV